MTTIHSVFDPALQKNVEVKIDEVPHLIDRANSVRNDTVRRREKEKEFLQKWREAFARSGSLSELGVAQMPVQQFMVREISAIEERIKGMQNRIESLFDYIRALENCQKAEYF
jgi:hypothetical protein